MADTRAQLDEIDQLIALSPDDPSLKQLRADLLQLIALEGEQEQEIESPAGKVDDNSGAGQKHPASGFVDVTSRAQDEDGSQSVRLDDVPSNSTHEEPPPPVESTGYSAKGTFTEHIVSTDTAASEAPMVGAFQVVSSSAKRSSSSAMPAQGSGNLKDDGAGIQGAEQPKKKKKKKDRTEAILKSEFELPTHLVPLESDTAAQKLKKQRAAKALKSKFKSKKKEAEHAKRQNDWKNFASGGKSKKKKKNPIVGHTSIFATGSEVDSKVGVGHQHARNMTASTGERKRHKFL